MIGALMLDIAGTELTQEDIELLQAPQVGGMILFARNIESPQQVRALTDHMRQIRPDLPGSEPSRSCRREFEFSHASIGRPFSTPLVCRCDQSINPARINRIVRNDTTTTWREQAGRERAPRHRRIDSR